MDLAAAVAAAAAAAAATAAAAVPCGSVAAGKKLDFSDVFFCVFARFKHVAAFSSFFGRFGTLLDFYRFWSPVFLGPSIRNCRQ